MQNKKIHPTLKLIVDYKKFKQINSRASNVPAFSKFGCFFTLWFQIQSFFVVVRATTQSKTDLKSRQNFLFTSLGEQTGISCWNAHIGSLPQDENWPELCDFFNKFGWLVWPSTNYFIPICSRKKSNWHMTYDSWQVTGDTLNVTFGWCKHSL